MKTASDFLPLHIFLTIPTPRQAASHLENDQAFRQYIIQEDKLINPVKKVNYTSGYNRLFNLVFLSFLPRIKPPKYY